MKTSQDSSIRQHVLYVLKGGGAHAKFEDVMGDFPAKLRGKMVSGLPYSAWMVLEHMRIAQWDILEFSRNRKHVSPEWPAGYWPAGDAPPSAAAWAGSIRSFQRDLERRCRRWWRILRRTYTLRFPGGTGRRCCARRCWWRITMPIIWGNW